MIKSYNIDVIFSSETKASMTRIRDVISRLGWNYWVSIKAYGVKGILALIWVVELNIQVLKSSKSLMHFKVKSEKEPKG